MANIALGIVIGLCLSAAFIYFVHDIFPDDRERMWSRKDLR